MPASENALSIDEDIPVASTNRRSALPLMALAIGHGSTRLHLPPSMMLRAMPPKSPLEAYAVFRLDALGAVQLIPGCLVSAKKANTAMQGACLAPAGTAPRLLLMSMVTEAIESNSTVLDLGQSTATVLKRIGIVNVGGGRQGPWTRWREQIRRLLGAKISFRRTIGSAWTPVFKHPHADRIRDPRFAISGARMTDPYLFDYIEFSEEFLDWCKERQVVGDILEVQKIQCSPTALDAYTWLRERASMDARRARVAIMFGVPAFSTTPNARKEAEMRGRTICKVLAAAPALKEQADAFSSEPHPFVAVDRMSKGHLPQTLAPSSAELTQHLCDPKMNGTGSS